MGNYSAETNGKKITQHSEIPTSFVAQACRIRNKPLLFWLNDAGVNVRRVKAKDYAGPFEDASAKPDTLYHVARLDDIRKVVQNKLGDRRIKWLNKAIAKVGGSNNDYRSRRLSMHPDALLALACILDRMALGVTGYHSAVREAGKVFEARGVMLKDVPIDFKKKMRSIAGVD